MYDTFALVNFACLQAHQSTTFQGAKVSAHGGPIQLHFGGKLRNGQWAKAS
jgi:hypothetical protein